MKVWHNDDYSFGKEVVFKGKEQWKDDEDQLDIPLFQRSCVPLSLRDIKQFYFGVVHDMLVKWSEAVDDDHSHLRFRSLCHFYELAVNPLPYLHGLRVAGYITCSEVSVPSYYVNGEEVSKEAYHNGTFLMDDIKGTYIKEEKAAFELNDESVFGARLDAVRLDFMNLKSGTETLDWVPGSLCTEYTSAEIEHDACPTAERVVENPVQRELYTVEKLHNELNSANERIQKLEDELQNAIDDVMDVFTNLVALKRKREEYDDE